MKYEKEEEAEEEEEVTTEEDMSDATKWHTQSTTPEPGHTRYPLVHTLGAMCVQRPVFANAFWVGS
eukprot:7274279-Pyramimonas_sp.AAC.2